MKLAIAIFSLVAILGLLGVVVSVSNPKSHAQGEQHQHSPGDEQDNAETGKTKKSQGKSKGWRKYKEAIERNEKFVTATSTIVVAAFTVALAVATFFLWMATRDLVRDSKETGEENTRNMRATVAESKRSADAAFRAVEVAEQNAIRDLRAYVFAEPTHLTIEKNALRLEVTITNGGKTPAQDVEHSTALRVRYYPMPPDYTPETPTTTSISKFTIFPGKEVKGYTTFNLPTEKSLREVVERRGVRFYVVGIVTYRDIFDQPRTSTFCSSSGGPEWQPFLDFVATGAVSASRGDMDWEQCPKYNDMK